jgi:hypothetical protein
MLVVGFIPVVGIAADVSFLGKALHQGFTTGEWDWWSIGLSAVGVAGFAFGRLARRRPRPLRGPKGDRVRPAALTGMVAQGGSTLGEFCLPDTRVQPTLSAVPLLRVPSYL